MCYSKWRLRNKWVGVFAYLCGNVIMQTPSKVI